MKWLLCVGRTLFFLAVGLLLCSVTIAYATTIGFVSVNLADVTPGDDLWRYDYIVSGRTFLQSEFFDIYFDPVLYGTLTALPAPNADWDVAILQQPNPVNLAPFNKGIFDAFALVPAPSLAGTFSVQFLYRGTGTPGAQMFEIFGANSSLLETGMTTPAGVIPEPSTVVLSLLGLSAFGFKVFFVRKTRR
jgi:hypothetical protein